MQIIRTLQYVILAFAITIVAIYFALTGSVGLLFDKFLNFNSTESLWNKIAEEPLLPIVLAITFCLCLGLEAFRTRLQRQSNN